MAPRLLGIFFALALALALRRPPLPVHQYKIDVHPRNLRTDTVALPTSGYLKLHHQRCTVALSSGNVTIKLNSGVCSGEVVWHFYR